jgi:hypothetical protein
VSSEVLTFPLSHRLRDSPSIGPASSMSLLFDGPREIFLYITLHFLTTDDLARLDSAVTNRLQRSTFLDALSSPEAVVDCVCIGGIGSIGGKKVPQPRSEILHWLRYTLYTIYYTLYTITLYTIHYNAIHYNTIHYTL